MAETCGIYTMCITVKILDHLVVLLVLDRKSVV